MLAIGQAILYLLLSAALPEEPDRLVLQLVDDRGEAMAAGIEACFQIETRMDCSPVARGTVEMPAEAVSVRVEGPGHGPATARKNELKTGPAGRASLVVPRKAFLEISPAPPGPLTLSFYRQDDSTFRSPFFRTRMSPGDTIRIPAGDHLVSLAGSGHAPDLHLLSAAPAARHKLDFRQRPGWSLVMRVLADRDGAPVTEANLEIRGTEGFATADSAPRQARSGKRGLALVSGLQHALASATVESPGFARRREEGLSATPGTFAFRETRLERTASLRAVVTTGGKPAAGMLCQVVEYELNPLGPAPEPVFHFDGRTDDAGICRASRLSPGPLLLRLGFPGSRSRVDRPVDLRPGEETEVELNLSAIRVQGTVSRGTQPLARHHVFILDAESLVPNATRRDGVAEAMTDEDGKYETVLWAPGTYFVLVYTPDETPAASHRSWLGSEEEQIDFSLEEHGVAGVVLDEKEQPVPQARVYLAWNRVHRFAATDERGSFLFLLSEPGEGRVEVLKAGYHSPPPVEVSSSPGVPPPPLVLHLRRAGLLTGRVLAPGPSPAGVSLTSFQASAAGMVKLLGATVSDREGRFEIAAAEQGTTRVFATGAGCPLTFFDLAPTTEEVTLTCSDPPASLNLQFADSRSQPLAGRSVLLRREGTIIPDRVLVEHLSRLRVPAASDGSGRLLLPALAPGYYELFLADGTSPELIAAGVSQGLLSSTALAPLTTTEIEIALDESP